MAEVRNGDGTCNAPLTNDADMNSVQYVQTTAGDDGIDFFFKSGTYKYNGTIVNLKLSVVCSSDEQNPVFSGYDGNTAHVVLKTQSGCFVFSTNFIASWISSQRYIWGAVLIAIGIVVGLFGKPLFKPTICIISTIVIMFILSVLCASIFFTRATPTWAGWVVFGVSLVIGMLGGLILAKLTRLGVGVLAGWGGFLLGVMMYSAFVYKIDNSNHVAFWVFNITVAVIFGVISMFLFDYAIIVATAIIGSYGFIRGISFYAGGYPDEFDLVNNLEIQNWDAIPSTFYAYFAVWIVLSIACMVF